MIDYLYDGTFEGFLTCIHFHYYEEKAAGIYPAGSYQTNMIQPAKPVATDEEKAATVYEAIKTKVSGYALEQIYHTFLSNEQEKENMILRYLRLGFKTGPALHSLHSHPVVKDVEKTAKRVAWEVHRLMGLVRFSALEVFREDQWGSGVPGEVLYGRIEPDHDVLELLGDHFADRLKSEDFILHDARRGKGLFSRNGKWYISPLPGTLTVELTPGEGEYRRLWKQYFETIAIEERRNPRCQKNFMPVRYWKNLTELN